jgi:S1-C subfamily serine protease
MKRTLLAFLAAALLAAPAITANHTPKPFESVRALATARPTVSVDLSTNSVVTVKVEYDNHCTTTSVNEAKHLWLTAAHCVANEDMTAIDNQDYFIGNEALGYHPALLVSVDLINDLALLTTPDYAVPALRMSTHDPSYGDKVSVYGHPFGWNAATLFEGIVSSPIIQFDPADKPYMIYQVACAPGNSGSAVLNSHDEIVSVLQISWTRTFGNVCGGSPWAITYSFIFPYLP